MAAKAQNSFDVNAFLATPATQKQSLLGMIGDKLENVVSRASYRVGKAVDGSGGLAEIYRLGGKEGEIDAKINVEMFRRRAAEAITAKLAKLQ